MIVFLCKKKITNDMLSLETICLVFSVTFIPHCTYKDFSPNESVQWIKSSCFNNSHAKVEYRIYYRTIQNLIRNYRHQYIFKIMFIVTIIFATIDRKWATIIQIDIFLKIHFSSPIYHCLPFWAFIRELQSFPSKKRGEHCPEYLNSDVAFLFI